MLKLTRLVALLATSALILSACGDDADMAGGHSGGEASQGLDFDRSFAAEMKVHHESAVEMAVIAQERGESAFVRRLAERIFNTQTNEIETLTKADARLAKAGAEKGSLGLANHTMGMDGDVESLKTAEPFDEAFIKMMIPHHEGAIEMAKAEVAKGSDPELQALAEEILAAQDAEITEMRDHLDANGAGSGDYG